MNGKKVLGGPEEKVATLRLPADAWNAMTPGGQLLFVMQQLLGFMASDFFNNFEGITVQVIDPADIKNCKVVLQIGKPPKSDSGLIIPN